jgi:hypothetical protein
MAWCPQGLLKMSEGLALPERCIIKTYFDAITSRTQWKDKALCHLCSLACGWVELSPTVLLSPNM